jgi:hypothetical protein
MSLSQLLSVCLLVFLVTVLHVCEGAGLEITYLGAFNHQADESSPLVWQGKVVIMETLPNYNPQHNSGFCGTDYFIVRDLASWNIIATVTPSCQHAFGAATVTTDSKGVETMWVYGTRWIRYDMNRDSTTIPSWDGPCNTGDCGVDVFWSTDLKSWKNGSLVNFPKGMVAFNTDVAPVMNSPSILPAHNWIMAVEHTVPSVSYGIIFYIKNSPTLDQGEWIALNVSKYFIPNFNTGGNQIGACPSVRYVGGYYYVTTGGQKIWIVRSKDLINWELGHYNGGALLAPDSSNDCKFISPQWSMYKPNNDTVQLMQQCKPWDTCVSDSDLTEFKQADGTVGTLLLYQPNNQAGIGFSSLILHKGNYQSFFQSYFN